jgi:hypothetical protein
MSLRKNSKEFLLDSSFSSLDIILNPETLSELIILFYSVYLNISTYQDEKKAMNRKSRDFDLDSKEITNYQNLNSFGKNEAELKNNLKTTIQHQHITNINTSILNKNKFKFKMKFRFNRLSCLMFHIEDQDLGKARKIALFDLNCVKIYAVVLPEYEYSNLVSNFDGLNVTDLNISKSNVVFGIGHEEISTSESKLKG